MMASPKPSYIRWLLLFIFLKLAWNLGMLMFYDMPLSPDEAQYFVWSQYLDWGYYSKPPGIAWQIWLTTHLTTFSALGIRIGAAVLCAGTTWGIFQLSRNAQLTEKTSFAAALCYLFSPIGVFTSFATTADGGLLLFWTLTCCSIVKSISKKEHPHFHIIGLLIALGSLFKWASYLIWVPILVYTWKEKWSWKQLIKGLLISILGLLPSLYWNLSHNFVTFRHHMAMAVDRNVGDHIPLFQGNFGDFFAAQIGIISPVLFYLLVKFFKKMKTSNSIPSGVIFCFFVGMSILLPFSFFSIFRKVQANWAFYAFPTLFIPVAWELFHEKRPWAWFKMHTIFCVTAITFILTVPVLQERSIGNFSFKINAFKHSLGWDKLPVLIKNTKYNPSCDFLFSDRYQLCSLLTFYSPEQQLAHFFNINQSHENQFSFWSDMEKNKGKDGYFLIVISSLNAFEDIHREIDHFTLKLQPYFEDVTVGSIETLYSCNSVPVKIGILMHCSSYNGKLPHSTNIQY